MKSHLVSLNKVPPKFPLKSAALKLNCGWRTYRLLCENGASCGVTYGSVAVFQDTKFLRKEILENLAPGREYCISVCFSDSLVPRKSNYSQPVCAFTPGNYNSGTAQLSVSLADSKHPHMEFAGGCLFFISQQSGECFQPIWFFFFSGPILIISNRRGW